MTDTTMNQEERTALRDTVRRLFADQCAESDVRRIMESDSGHDPALWRSLAELGIAGLLVAAGAGGSQLSAVELELVMEEAGAALAPVPLISTAMASVLLDGELAEALATGRTIAAVALLGALDWTGGSTMRIEGGRAQGTARFVPDAGIADIFLLASDEGVHLVERASAEITPLPTFDRTRRMADVRFDGAATRIGDGAAARRARDIGLVALAGEQTGGARRIFDITVDYARERHQFGRAIGSFQAIKHMAADLLLEAESATSAARDAARQVAEGAVGKDAAVALAAFACADAFLRCAKDGIQMHGGIAFTWDHPAHLYLRRARSGVQLFGDSRVWRDRYVAALDAMQKEMAA